MILQVQPRWMTCHSLMQFASLAGEGHERAHSRAVDGFFFCFFFKAMKEGQEYLHNTICFENTNIMWLRASVAKTNQLNEERNKFGVYLTLPVIISFLITDTYQTCSQVSVSFLSWFNWWESRQVYVKHTSYITPMFSFLSMQCSNIICINIPWELEKGSNLDGWFTFQELLSVTIHSCRFKWFAINMQS